jgi:hypothetical protein
MNSSFYNPIENTNINTNAKINTHRRNKMGGNINAMLVRGNAGSCLPSPKKQIMRRSKIEKNKSMHTMNNKKIYENGRFSN